MYAPACPIRYADSDSKGMGRDIWICGAVVAGGGATGNVVASISIACKGLHRFCNPQGVADEAQSSTFEPAMTEPDSLIRKSAIRIVDATKLICGDEP